MKCVRRGDVSKEARGRCEVGRRVVLNKGRSCVVFVEKNVKRG